MPDPFPTGDAVGHVYVVDDDVSVLKATERLLRSAGLRVDTFASAVAFLAQVHSQEVPACVVLDLMMPELSGLDVQDRLFRLGHDLPIVFLSGQGDVPSVASAMRRGAVDFLVKPPEDQELVVAVARALTRDVERRRRERAEEDVRTRLARLTSRERQVCQLVATGLLNKQIAGELGVHEKTVKQHRGRMMRKLEVQSVAALVRLLALLPELDVESPAPVT